MSLSNKHRQTLACLYILLTSHAQLIIDTKKGILKRPLGDEYVVYDFKPAFPPYTKELLHELLLLPDEQLQVDNEINENGSHVILSDLSTDEKVHTVTVDETESATEKTIIDQYDSLNIDEQSQPNMEDPADIEEVDTSQDLSNGSKTEQETDLTKLSSPSDEHSAKVVEDLIVEIENETHTTTHESVDNSTKYLDNDVKPNVNLQSDSDVDVKTSDAVEATTGMDEDETFDEFPGKDDASTMLSEDTGSSFHTASSEASSEDGDDRIEQSDVPTTDDDDVADVTTADDDVALNESENNPDVIELGMSSEEKTDETESIIPIDQYDESTFGNDFNHQERLDDDFTVKTNDESTQQESTAKLTINYDELPPISNLNKDQDANREFVTGLDEIDKFFESVSPPDELDVGADGSSMQDVLVGQGVKIIVKRAKSVGNAMKERFGKIVGKAMPQQLVNLARGGEEEEESFEDIFKMLENDDPLNTKIGTGNKKKIESTNVGENDKLENRFPLLKKPQVNKIYKYAKRKWQQAKYLFDDLMSIFGGEEDDDDIDFSADFRNMNFDDVRSLVEKNRITSGEMLKFGSEVDDSFIRSRHDAILKQQGKNSESDNFS